jgi:hypothetical protein
MSEGAECLHIQHQSIDQATINKTELNVYVGRGRGYETSSNTVKKWAFHLENERWEKIESDLPMRDVGRARE